MQPQDERDQVADSRENTNESAADESPSQVRADDGAAHATGATPTSETSSSDVASTPDEVVAPARPRPPLAALPVRLAPIDHMLSVGGVVSTLGGIGIAVCGVAAPGLVAPLASLGSPVLLGGVLALGGAVLLGIGRVRRALGSVERTLTVVQVETDRIDAVAQDGRDLRRDVSGVMDSTSALRHEMTTVQRRLDELTKLAANPEIQTSMFHLAASQDQLAKRLDLAMTDRFRALSTEIGGMAEAVARSQREFAAELRNVSQHVDARFDAHDQHVQQVLDVLQAESKDQCARIDRVLATLDFVTQELVRQREALIEGLGAANDAAQRIAAENENNLEVLREQVESRLETHVLALGERVERARQDLQRCVDDAHSAQSDAVRELGERVRTEVAEHAATAHRGITDLGVDLDVALESARTEFAVGIAALAPRLEESAEERSLALVARLDADAQAARDAWSALERRIGELETEFERRLAAGSTELARRWDELAAANADEREKLHARLSEFASETRASSTELHAEVVALAPRLEAVAQEHVERLQADARTRTTELKSDVEAAVTQIERGLDRVDGAHAQRHDELVRRVQEEHARDRGELERSLSALESKVVEQSAGLAPELGRVFENLASGLRAGLDDVVRATGEGETRVHEKLGELGECLTRSMTRVDDGQATVLGEISGQLTADRMRADRALQEGLRSIETSLQRVHDELSLRVGSAGTPEGGLVVLEELRAQMQFVSRTAEGSSEALRMGFEELASRFDERLRERNQSLTDDLIALAELARETPRGPRALEHASEEEEDDADDDSTPSSACLPHLVENAAPRTDCPISEPLAALPRAQRADVEVLVDGAPLFVAQLPTTVDASMTVASEASPTPEPTAEAPASEPRPDTGDAAH